MTMENKETELLKEYKFYKIRKACLQDVNLNDFCHLI